MRPRPNTFQMFYPSVLCSVGRLSADEDRPTPSQHFPDTRLAMDDGGGEDVLRGLCRRTVRLSFALPVSGSVTEPGFTVNPLRRRPAAALSLQNPIQREVTVSNDPSKQL